MVRILKIECCNEGIAWVGKRKMEKIRETH